MSYQPVNKNIGAFENLSKSFLISEKKLKLEIDEKKKITILEQLKVQDGAKMNLNQHEWHIQIHNVRNLCSHSMANLQANNSKFNSNKNQINDKLLDKDVSKPILLLVVSLQPMRSVF